MTTILRAIRLVSIVASVVAGTREVRSLYIRRKHLWQVLRKLVRQLG